MNKQKQDAYTLFKNFESVIRLPFWHLKMSCLCLCASVVVMAPVGANAQGSEPVGEWLDLLRSIEQQTNVLEYDVESRAFTAESAEELANPKPTGEMSKFHILLENDTGRHFVDAEMLSRNDTGGLSAGQEITSFNGETSMYLDRRIRGGEESFGKTEEYFTMRATIGENRQDLSMEKGLDIFPAFYRNKGIGHVDLLYKGLSKTIEEAKDAYFVQEPGDIIQVNYLQDRREEKGLSDWIRCRLDMEKGGVIVQTKWFHLLDGDPQEYPLFVKDIEYTQTEQGDWIPVSAREVIGGLYPKRIITTTYSNVGINHKKPGPKEFSIKFPPGTRVTDTRTGESHRVGMNEYELEQVIAKSIEDLNPEDYLSEAKSEPANEARTSLEKAELNPVDNSGKLQMAAELDTLANMDKQVGAGPKVWFIMGAAILASGLAVFVFLAKKGYMRKTVMLFIVISLIVCETSRAGEVNHQSTNPKK